MMIIYANIINPDDGKQSKRFGLNLFSFFLTF